MSDTIKIYEVWCCRNHKPLGAAFIAAFNEDEAVDIIFLDYDWFPLADGFLIESVRALKDDHEDYMVTGNPLR